MHSELARHLTWRRSTDREADKLKPLVRKESKRFIRVFSRFEIRQHFAKA